MTRTLESNDLPSLFEPGMRVYVGGSTNEPRGIIDALKQNPACADGVTFVQFPLPGVNVTDFTTLHPNARMEVFFLTPQLRDSFVEGRVALIPMQMRQVFEYLRDCEPFDLTIIQLAAADGNAHTPGPNVDFLEAVIDNAGAVLAEVNADLPRLPDAPRVPRERVDYAFPTSTSIPEYPAAETNSVARAIGSHVATLVADGACIQTGIGAIPAAVLDALGDKNDLGV
ncbi:MAG: hypothetical protein O7G84_03575, partial [Gammaproteobacteria bacterium]|nr:hypothetical protein [Gammaproteobacteria bacterium]